MKKIYALLLGVLGLVNYTFSQNCSISLKENNLKFCSNDSLLIKSVLGDRVDVPNYYDSTKVLDMADLFKTTQDANNYKGVIASGLLKDKDLNQITTMLSQQPYNISLNNITSITDYVDLKIVNSQNLSKVLISSGKLTLTIYTDLTQETSLELEFPTIKKDGQPLKASVKIDANLSASLNKPVITTIDLSNTIIDLSVDGGKLKYIVKPNLVIRNTTTSAKEKILMKIQVTDFKFSNGFSYKWLKDGVVIPNATDVSTIKIKESGTYKVVATSSGLCPELTDEIKITKITMPSNKLNTALENKICEGDTLNLKSLEPTTYSYLWSDNSTKTNTFKATKSGAYSVKITNDICTAQSDVINLVVNPKPVLKLNKKDTTIINGSQLTLKATGGKTYLWSTKSDKDSIVVKDKGTYTVTGTNEFGCSSSSSVVINVREKGVGLSTLNGLNLAISPNPASEVLHITLEEYMDKSISIVDLKGNLVFTQALNSLDTDIQIESFAKGIYLLNIHDGYNTILNTQRIVIE
jgi:hypothetical protein